MNRIGFSTGILTLLMLALLVTACDRTVPPPTPLTEQEFAGVVETAFAAAKSAPAKESATALVAAFKVKEYPKAFAAVQSLVAVPDLSKEQANVAARASLTISSLLQAAQAQGDTKATTTLENYRKNK